MVEENPVKPFDTSLYGIYKIKEAAEVCAVQLTDNIEAVLKIADVTRAEHTRKKVYQKNGIVLDYEETKYFVRDKGVAYPGDWLVWNGSYLAVLSNKDFCVKYAPARANSTA